MAVPRGSIAPGAPEMGAAELAKVRAEHPVEPFYRALGQRALTRQGVLWCAAGRFTLITFPNNARVTSTRREVQQLLVDSGRLAAVFCPAEGSGPRVREYSLEAKDYGLDRLQHQFRTHVRRHASRFECRGLDWDEMGTLAAEVNADTAIRHGIRGRSRAESGRWTVACRAAAETRGLTAFGCISGEALAAYVVAWQDGITCHGVLISRNSRFDADRVGNVLMYSFSRAYISRGDVARINLGRSWYPPKPNLDSFKRHAGYEERDVTVAVVLHPRLESLLRSSWTRRCLIGARVLTGGRVNFDADLDVIDAARLTDIP